jgi:hypothetical protein
MFREEQRMRKVLVNHLLCGLDYIHLDVPIKTIKGYEIIDVPPWEIQEEIAKRIVSDRIPIRGAEAEFLRKHFRKTKREWADMLGVSKEIINHLETYTVPIPKVYVCVYRFIGHELLNLQMDCKWSTLTTNGETPEKLVLVFGDKND